ARVLGIITNRDLEHAAFLPALCGFLAWDRRRLKSPRVSDLMTWSVVTISPDAPLTQAGLLMFERRIGSLVVVENDRLVGILTGGDLLRAGGSALKGGPHEAHHLRHQGRCGIYRGAYQALPAHARLGEPAHPGRDQ